MNRFLGSILLIAGTCVGAGMLAMPVSTAAAGFFPSIALLIVMWLAMFLTGLYVLEANVSITGEANFISMAKRSLGKWGEVVAWITYLLLLYSLMAAYLTGGGAILTAALKASLTVDLPSYTGPLVWVLIAAAIIYCGARKVDGLNRLLVVGLVITYLLLIVFITPNIHLSYLSESHSIKLLFALPIVITAFGYHVIIPSLRVYMQGDAKKLAKIIFWGSFIPLAVYLFWELDVFGVIPLHGDQGLVAILNSGQPATELSQALAHSTNSPVIVNTSKLFIFFAIATSFLGISFSIFDFIADGFKIKKSGFGKVKIACLTFIPPLIFTYCYPHGFIVALSYAGVFVAILHGILPALMVVNGRKKGINTAYQAPGGYAGLLLIILLSVLVIVSQIYVNFV